jgi:hypothetical protein
MADVTIRVLDDEVQRMLQRAPRQVSRAMRQGMEDATALLLRTMITYPPKVDSSVYRRTGTLGRSWSRRIDGAGLTIRGEVGSNANIAPYNRVVQDRERQARVHRGRWITVQSAAQRNERAIDEMFRRRLEQVLR